MSIRVKIKKKTKGARLVACLLLFFVAGGVGGCASLDGLFNLVGLGDSSRPDTAESLAMDGLDDFNHGKYSAALETLEDLKNRYPFSQYSLLAELKIADCYYYLGKYLEAAILYEEFENNHPTNEAIPYVMFQIGMCHYNMIDTIDRDPAGAYNALQEFSRLIRTFPVSAFTTEARARMLAAQNFLANHEYYVADYYLRTKAYKQAEGRLEFLVNTYTETEIVPRAEKILAGLKEGNPPKRTWRSWLPELSLPDWKSFQSLSFGAGGGAGPAD